MKIYHENALRIGIDFDNTIICYDRVFHKIALEWGVIPEDLPVGKDNVRDYLRSKNNEDAWTQMQGYVYGNRLNDAEAFPNVWQFFKQCSENNISVYIVSHKTKTPYQGKPYDLHKATLEWLESECIFDDKGLGFPRDNVFLELSKESKAMRITTLECDYFIDDLPEFLEMDCFPKKVFPILFDPKKKYSNKSLQKKYSWEEIIDFFQLD